MKNASFLYTFHVLTRYLLFVLFWAGMPGTDVIRAQTDPLPFECAMCCQGQELNLFSGDCPHTSPLWRNNALHIPREDARTIYVRANFIILRKSDDPDPDVQGNFSEQDAEHMAFLQEIVDNCNWSLRNLNGVSNCTDLRTDAKIQIVPNFIFLKDAYAWDADHTQGKYKCPAQDQTFWHLADLSHQLHSDPDIPTGINVFFPIQGDIYDRLIVLGAINRPDADPGYCKWWCSEWPSNVDLQRSSSICVPNLYMKYRWFQLHPEVTGFPFDPAGRAVLINEALRSLPHEFAHAFIDCYTHIEDVAPCENHLLTSSDGMRNVLRAEDLGCMHRNLAISNLRQFVDCTETYNAPGSSASDRVVTQDETWDLNMRLYTNLRVKTGATLTLSCELLMPADGLITVERGARLIVKGGTIKSANTCGAAQYWQGIVAQGNGDMQQPLNPNGILPADQSSVVQLIEDGVIEGALVGVSTREQPGEFSPAYSGALIQAENFTFRDCQKGVEFLKYDFPNHSSFRNTRFESTGAGSMQTGVYILDTDGISFEGCSFEGASGAGINAWDASFTVKRGNRFSGSDIGILAGASAPLSGRIKIGEPGLQGADRNQFEGNIVGIRATSNARVEVFSNDFSDMHVDLALNGATQSDIYDNHFSLAAAGNQLEYTGIFPHNARCNQYRGNDVSTNIVGKNTGFSFQGEDYGSRYYDLFIEGIQKNPGEIRKYNGGIGAALWNYFSLSVNEQIKTSKVAPYGYTEHFYYVHPDPDIDPRVKPYCAANGNCAAHSHFSVIQSTGEAADCAVPEMPTGYCSGKSCLDAVRNEIQVKTQQYQLHPTEELAAGIQALIAERERITEELVSEYRNQGNWSAAEVLLGEDPNPFNKRRMVGARIEQKQFQSAAALLQTFPQNTEDDQYFIQVQQINIARLSNPAFQLNAVQEAVLQQIATDAGTEAGYAQSLLGILKGQVFLPHVPVLEEAQNQSPARVQEPDHTLQPFPNPDEPAQRTDFAPTGAKWYYDELDFALNGIPHVIEVVDKAYFQGKWCSKLQPSSTGSVSFPTAWVYTENDTVYYYSEHTQQFEMLYDFTAEAGDTWVIGGLAANIPGSPAPYASDTIRVDSVGMTLIGGDTLKTWYVHHGPWFDWGKRIFEKAGNERLFLPRFGLYDADIWGLRCFESPEEAYHFVTYPCDAILPYSAAHTPPSGRLQIAPNPAFGETRISLPAPVRGEWSLYDLRGQMIRVGDWDGDAMLLRLDGLGSGAYVFRVRSFEGVVFFGVFLVWGG